MVYIGISLLIAIISLILVFSFPAKRKLFRNIAFLYIVFSLMLFILIFDFSTFNLSYELKNISRIYYRFGFDYIPAEVRRDGFVDHLELGDERFLNLYDSEIVKQFKKLYIDSIKGKDAIDKYLVLDDSVLEVWYSLFKNIVLP